MDGVKPSLDVLNTKDKSPRHLSLEEIKDLIIKSHEAKRNSYCRYSKFRVGAALKTCDNRVFTGKLWV